MSGLRQQKAFEDIRRTGKKLVDKISAEVKQAKIDDDARFLKSWLDNPLKTGAVSPSSKALAKKMASYVDPLFPAP